MSATHLPPNQQLVSADKWPVVGEKSPRLSDAPWTVEICGLVRNPRVYSLKELLQEPQSDLTVDIHCVTRWSRPASRFRGIPLEALLKRANPTESAGFVSFNARSERNHSTSLSLNEALTLGVFLALEFEAKPIISEHGGPVRIVTPGRYFYKSLKWLERIELLAEDRLGFWEAESGYHNTGDPWLEQRYMAPALDRREAQRLIESRDFSNRDLRSIDASGRSLDGLNARNALLRDANFRSASLHSADFTAANLSNAHLQSANLRDASFRSADVEGADFTGANLRGADFTGASIFGATFVSESAESALMDETTRIPRELLETLTDHQHKAVLALLGF